jgi:adenylate kinase family enzyme
MRRISVVGNSGSGKSTIARQLARALGIPHLELDSVFHQPGWQPRPVIEFQGTVRQLTREDDWVIDGNYRAVRDIIWERADTVVWFDLPRAVVMRQIIWRTLRRVVIHEELWNGNREPTLGFLSRDPEKSVIAWAWHKHAEHHARYSAAASDPKNSHITFVQLKDRTDARRLVESAQSTPANELGRAAG